MKVLRDIFRAHRLCLTGAQYGAGTATYDRTSHFSWVGGFPDITNAFFVLGNQQIRNRMCGMSS